MARDPYTLGPRDKAIVNFILIGTSLLLGDPAVDAASAEHRDFFETKVRPILVDRCYECHSAESEEFQGGLLLDSREGWRKGGDSGPALEPGKPDDSLIVQAVRYGTDGPQMPPSGKLSQAEIDVLVQWVSIGAPDPRDGKTAPPPKKEINIDAGKDYWAFRPISTVSIPIRMESPRPENPLDAFVSAKLEANGLAASPPASKDRVFRRLHLDLLGMPPEYAATQDFLQDIHPDAYERVVDRLLASPRFGERWGRHWLDVARFAESFGFEHDYDRPYAYHYRDFVIQAFNEDMPFDQFLRWQLAGDEFAPENPRALQATGFLGAGVFPTQITANEVERTRYDALDDMLATTTSAMLGLSVGCARCHDHKFDPIPTLDYYRMLSTFTTTVRSEVQVDMAPQETLKRREQYERERDRKVAELRRFEREELALRGDAWMSRQGYNPLLATWIRPWYRWVDSEWRTRFLSLAEHIARQPKPQLTWMMIASEGVPPLRKHTQGADFFPETYLLKRGDTNLKDIVATQSFLQILMPRHDAQVYWQTQPPAGAKTSYRRRSLANWIVDSDQGAGGLAARVIVNRLWQHHFGVGIVSTPNDFGVQGDRPSHPELMDWLAGELLDGEWRLKRLHQLILTSASYRQASSFVPAMSSVDPENRLLWRWTPRRLEAEPIRDSLLAVSGLLDTAMFGPGTLDPAQRRRSIYFTVKRSQMTPFLQLFDAPDALTSLGRRSSTTIAPQALAFLNDPAIRSWAESLGGDLSPQSKHDVGVASQLAYQRVLGRDPSSNELQASAKFLLAAVAGGADNEQLWRNSLADLIQVLFGTNEFIYMD